MALSTFITISQYKVKQAQCNLVPIEKQIVIVYAIVEGYLNEIHTMILLLSTGINMVKNDIKATNLGQNYGVGTHLMFDTIKGRTC